MRTDGGKGNLTTTLSRPGSSERAVAGLMMRLPGWSCLSYDPLRPDEAPRTESLETNRQLKRRYYLVQRARDAGIIGKASDGMAVVSLLRTFLSIISITRPIHLDPT
jgi:hypothetical protein